MIILAFDTSTVACSAAVLDSARVLAARREPMERGHQERLALMVQEVMREAGVEFPELQRIGVTVGPGSFTGLRVGIAFAKGLSLALAIDAVGIGTLEALALSSPVAKTTGEGDRPQGGGGGEPQTGTDRREFGDTAGDSVDGARPLHRCAVPLPHALRYDGGEVLVACMDARRGQVYVQAFEDGEPLIAGQALTVEDAAAAVGEVSGGRPIHICGSGAAMLAEHLPDARVSALTSPDPVVLAHLAAARTPGPLAPIYLRAPDAKLPL